MNTKNFPTYILVVALAGALFSGWLTFNKLVLGNCPLREACAYLFDLPTCVYGFVMFGSILVLAVLMKTSAKKNPNHLLWINRIALIGILFSGYYSFIELMYPACPLPPCIYSLGLPSCVYGLIMYSAVWVMSNKLLKKK